MILKAQAAKSLKLPDNPFLYIGGKISEHHIGLALDLYLIIDGKDVVENEDMIQYPEIWETIHSKLVDYGFILRYPDGKEHITGYGYEPWHIRYLDDVSIAKEIMDSGVTLEGWLGAVNETNAEVDYGTSEIFTPEQLAEAAIQIKCTFAPWEGCELHNLRYAGDEADNEEKLAWLNSSNEEANFTHVAKFLTDFHSPVEASGAWDRIRNTWITSGGWASTKTAAGKSWTGVIKNCRSQLIPLCPLSPACLKAARKSL